jgi:hypothetical protein
MSSFAWTRRRSSPGSRETPTSRFLARPALRSTSSIARRGGHLATSRRCTVDRCSGRDLIGHVLDWCSRKACRSSSRMGQLMGRQWRSRNAPSGSRCWRPKPMAPSHPRSGTTWPTSRRRGRTPRALPVALRPLAARLHAARSRTRPAAAYAQATLTDPDTVVGRALFEVFPENPDEPRELAPVGSQQPLEGALQGWIARLA